MTTLSSRSHRSRRQKTPSTLSGMFDASSSSNSIAVPVVTRTNSVMSLASSTTSSDSLGNTDAAQNNTDSMVLSRRLRRMKRRLLLEAVAGDAGSTTRSIADRRTQALRRDDSMSSMSDNSAD